MVGFKYCKAVVQAINLKGENAFYQTFEETYPHGTDDPIPLAAVRAANEYTDDPNCKEVRCEIIAKKYSP